MLSAKQASFVSRELLKRLPQLSTRNFSALARAEYESEARQDMTSTTVRWDRLAALTHDPMIIQLSKKMKREKSLPESMLEAMADSRAVVLTSLDGRIVDVNDAWVNLCGYNRVEALDRTLDQLLHGPSTEFEITTDLMGKLRHGCAPHCEAVVTNYTRQGRKFQNLVRLKSIYAGDGEQFYMGVLSEIPNDSYLR